MNACNTVSIMGLLWSATFGFSEPFEIMRFKHDVMKEGREGVVSLPVRVWRPCVSKKILARTMIHNLFVAWGSFF
jgi:hypothetical protein